ncbi:hypothetical protein, partial [Cupriavidus respiraculi]|uniref:hypothetical protein n=1 Tax=Cupriavidus respiraculi TaxID=195930 RepID=UPI0039F11140
QSQPGIAFYSCVSSTHRDTFTTSHIVKEQPIIMIVLAMPNESTQCRALSFGDQSKVPSRKRSGGG